ncbi:MAG: TetR/AcrR family transcriptional regulator [Leptospiraceae bacterium]|nr:TetR/AcrR family transcriptional regulator [Leptospiraceae bacterium]
MSKPQDPRAKPLNRENILKVALKLADSKGIESLSMRKLAEKLHVKAMSLYNHVKDKDDVLSGIVDIVVGKISLPEDNIEWKTAMRQRAISAHEILLGHPWASSVLMSQSNVGPEALGYIDKTLGFFRRAGFSIEMADHGWNLLDSYIYGYTLQELNYPFDMKKVKLVAKDYLPFLKEYPYLLELTQYIVDSSYKKNFQGVHDFSFGLEIILDGLEKNLISGKFERKGK